MKDPIVPQKIIGPGYRPDPPPKVVGPACDGDCACSDCATESAGKVTLGEVQRVNPIASKATAIEQRMLSEATLKTLRAMGIDPSRALDDPRQRRLSSCAATWSAQTFDALVEMELSHFRWSDALHRWVTPTSPQAQRTITVGGPSPLDLGALNARLGPQIRNLLTGGILAEFKRRTE